MYEWTLVITGCKFLGFGIAIAPQISLQYQGCGYVQSRWGSSYTFM